MSTTAKIDFEPGLFDEGQPEAAPDLPAIQPKRRVNRAPFIVAGGLLFVLAVAFFTVNTASKTKQYPARFTESSQMGRVPISLPETEEPHSIVGVPASVGTAMQTLSSPARWCEGDEVICTTTTSGKPVETLQKLIAAIPQSGAKKYRIRLAVVPVDEAELIETQEPHQGIKLNEKEN